MSDNAKWRMLDSFDAKEWAEEFCSRFAVIDREDPSREPRDLDVGLMIGWFANALMKGYAERASATRLRDCVLLPRAALFEFMGSLLPQGEGDCAPVAERCVKFVEENDLTNVTFT